MIKSKFFQFLKEAKIVDIDFPLKGVDLIFPYGQKILNNIEKIIFEKLCIEGYVEVGLPTAVPNSFLGHLRQKELINAKNEHISFFLSPGSEIQASYLASRLIKNIKELPLKIYNKKRSYRQVSKSSFIKNMEIIDYGINSFFEKKEEILSEVKKLTKIYSEILEELNIPFIIAKDDEKSNSQIKFYAYFNSEEKFGSIFAIKPQFEEIIKNFNKNYPLDKLPLQLDSNFTSRLLAAFLSNNLDEKGFIFNKQTCPYDIFLHSPNKEIIEIIKKMRLKYFIYEGSTNEAYITFLRMGIPLFLGIGSIQIKIRSRNKLNVKWVTKSNIKKELKKLFKNYTPPIKITKIKKIKTNTLPKIIKPNYVYLVRDKNIKNFKDHELKILGYIGNYLAFVKRKY